MPVKYRSSLLPALLLASLAAGLDAAASASAADGPPKREKRTLILEGITP